MSEWLRRDKNKEIKMKRRNICIGLLGVLCLASPILSQQTSPTPPTPPVLSDAKKQQIQTQIQLIATTIGITGLDMTTISMDTQSSKWEDWPNFTIRCFVDQTVGQSKKRTEFILDYDTGTLVALDLSAVCHEGERFLALGTTPTVTSQQAEAKVLSILNFSGYGNQDWRLDTTEIDYHEQSSWSVVVRKYINNFSNEDECAIASVDRFSGMISRYSLMNNSIRLFPQNSFLPEATTRQIATNAFHTVTGTTGSIELVNSMDSPVWRRIPNQYPFGYQYSRATERYIFKILDDLIEVLVDAETGEIWHVEGLVAGFSKLPIGKNAKPQKVTLGKHIILSSQILSEKKYNGLGRAIASGFPLKKVPVHSTKLGLSLSCTTAKRNISFIFDNIKRELIWETETKGKWSGVKLSKDESERLSKWLKTAKL
jgi:hypothetical protein